MLILGTSVSNAFTFVHFVEESEQVKYRKYKNINIFIEDEGRWQSYRLFSKKAGWTMDMAGLEKLLEDKHISMVKIINGIHCNIVDLASSYPVIREDIRSNNAGNITRFSMKLYLRDAVKAMLATAGIRTQTDIISHDPGLH
jgi:hypothetical protein